jgi:hypothetical protein
VAEVEGVVEVWSGLCEVRQAVSKVRKEGRNLGGVEF